MALTIYFLWNFWHYRSPLPLLSGCHLHPRENLELCFKLVSNSYYSDNFECVITTTNNFYCQFTELQIGLKAKVLLLLVAYTVSLSFIQCGYLSLVGQQGRNWLAELTGPNLPPQNGGLLLDHTGVCHFLHLFCKSFQCFSAQNDGCDIKVKLSMLSKKIKLRLISNHSP